MDANDQQKQTKKEQRCVEIAAIGDDRFPTTPSSGTSGAATAWLDDRIAEQRKTGYTTSFTTDVEAKRRARNSSAETGVKREAPTKASNHPSTSSSSVVSIAKEDAISKSQASRRDSHLHVQRSSRHPSNTAVTRNEHKDASKYAFSESVRSALDNLEKEVLRTMPKTAPKTVCVSNGNDMSSKTGNGILAKLESEVEDKAHPNNVSGSQSIITMDEDATTKTLANSRPTDACLSKRLNQTEDDVTTKARAMGSSSSARVIKQLNQMEEDVAAKARGRGSASSVSVAKRLNQMEEDVAAKSRARENPDSMLATKRLNQMQEDVAAKGHDRESNTRANVSRGISQLEEDVATKARSKASHSTPKVAKRRSLMEDHVAEKAQDQASHDSTMIPAVTSAGSIELIAQCVKEPTVKREGKLLTELENDIVSKEADRGHVIQSGEVRASLMDNRLAIKTGASSLGTDATVTGRERSGPGAVAKMSHDLEERIAYKTGIPLPTNDMSGEAGGMRVPASSSMSRLSKLTGIPSQSISLNKDDLPLERAFASGVQNTEHGETPLEYHLDLEVFGGENEGDRLAVAFAVKDEDEDVFIPAAVEYDPDAKPPIYKNRRFRMYGILGCSLLIIIMASMIGGLTIQQANKSPPIQTFPTGAPTCARCGLGIEGQLELVVGSEKLYDTSTPYSKAKDWILYEDPMELLPNAPNLIQRFVLATFYFDSHEEGEWLSCNRKNKKHQNETCSLMKVVGIFPLQYEGVPANRWLSSLHECKWAGLFCDELNQTRGIDLHGQGMKGTFPASLTLLPYVQTFTFSWNNFTGNIPAEIGTMKHLLNLEFHYNQFTGSLPGSWTNAKNLQLLNVAGNLLSGQIPSDIKFLSNLKGLFLSENMLTGSFPDEIGQVSLLTYARFDRNLLDGPINPIFGNFQLNELWLQNQPLKDTIPSELGKLSNYLFDLRLQNTEIEGTIPEEVFELKNLWRLDLHTANFTGTLSTLVGRLHALEVLRISNNRFTGSLPTELESLSQLKTVWVDGNDFNGTVPFGLCVLRGPEGLEDLSADCLMDPVNGEVDIDCECCTYCCGGGDGMCEESSPNE